MQTVIKLFNDWCENKFCQETQVCVCVIFHRSLGIQCKNKYLGPFQFFLFKFM